VFACKNTSGLRKHPVHLRMQQALYDLFVSYQQASENKEINNNGNIQKIIVLSIICVPGLKPGAIDIPLNDHCTILRLKPGGIDMPMDDYCAILRLKSVCFTDTTPMRPGAC